MEINETLKELRKAKGYTQSDVAKLLDIHRNSVYNMVNKRDLFVTVKVNDKIRIYKDSFEAWYKSQNRHTIVAS